ncbi:RNA-binding domain-containing protein [Limosilactobacillus fermentum]|uniref:RNA-binding domain-containing protein n=1 Tax=Limosilactobacillus fermentum TaxID=1613 RepID=UPI003CC7F48F
MLEDCAGETERFEFKLGLYSFNPQTQKKTFNTKLVSNIAKKATSFANTPSHKSSYIMIGVADSDSYNASDLGIEPFKIGPISIVGIKRDLILSGKSIDEYYQHYFSALSQEPVSEEMMTMLKGIKSYTYNGATVLSIKIDNTGKPEPYNDKYYRREGTNTVELNVPDLISLTQNLQKHMDD